MTDGIPVCTQMTINKKGMPEYIFPLSGALVGTVVFILIYGLNILNPVYTGWLTSGDLDLAQHYLGWVFYRDSPWTFPIGIATGNAYPFGISVSYTDSIPILAIPFKLLGPVLPGEFQYFGWWGIGSFALQGFFASLILRRWTKSVVMCATATGFFVLSPVMINRMFAHTALAGHWLILWSIFLYFRSLDGVLSWRQWIIVAAVSILIHPYFTPMVFMVLAACLAYDYMEKRSVLRVLALFAACTAAVIGTAFLLGMFTVGYKDISIGGFGGFSMNFNALVNPLGWSRTLMDLPLADKWQYEGFQYMGLGGILLVLFGVYRGAMQGFPELCRRSFLLLLIISILITLFAASNNLSFNDSHLTIRLPDSLLKILAIYRSSGRLFWPVFYLILLWGCYKYLSGNRGVKVTLLLVGLLIVQYNDISQVLEKRHESFTSLRFFKSPMKSEFWDRAARAYKHACLLPANFDYWQNYSEFASRHHMTINAGYFARSPNEKIGKEAEKNIELLKKGIVDKDTLYFIKDWNLYHLLSRTTDGAALTCFVDGFGVLAPKNKITDSINLRCPN